MGYLGKKKKKRDTTSPFPFAAEQMLTGGPAAWVMQTPSPQPNAKAALPSSPSALQAPVLLNPSCFISGGIESPIILPESRRIVFNPSCSSL